MSRLKRLQDAISIHLMPSSLTIEDETYQHVVPAGSESHFKAIIVSALFEPLNRIARHRLVNQIIQNEFSTGLHALTLHLYTPNEWKQKNSTIPASPACKGRNRHGAPLEAK